MRCGDIYGILSRNKENNLYNRIIDVKSIDRVLDDAM